MLSKLIVDIYGWIIEVYIWLAILIAGIFGYHYAAPVLKSVGLIIEPHIGGNIVGALIFAVAAFLASAVTMGPILLLVEIRNSMRTIQASADSAHWDLSSERKEPFI